MSLKINHISPSFIRDLDTALPNWRDLVPEDRTTDLNEETLIQLLKNRKRAEIYRLIADKRNAMFKEMYTSEDKSVLDLTKEFGTFSYEQTSKWWEIEGKLNSIIIQFRSRKKIEDVKKLRPSFDAITKRLNEIIDAIEKEAEVSMKTIMNNTINVVSGGNDELIKELNDLFNTQIPKFQQENKAAFEDYKKFVNGSLGELIRDKISKIEQGELSPDSLKRSDLFTDEEEKELENKCIQTVEGIINRRCKLNIDSFEDVILKTTELEGKEKFLEKIDNMSTDFISIEAKQAIRTAIESGFILPFKNEDISKRQKREVSVAVIVKISAKIVSGILKTTAAFLKEEAKNRKNNPVINDDFYKWCNGDNAVWKHIITWGVCSGWTVGELQSHWELEKSLDLNGVANVLSFAAFMIDFSVNPFSTIIWTSASLICEFIMKKENIEYFDFFCGGLEGVLGKYLYIAKKYLESKKLII